MIISYIRYYILFSTYFCLASLFSMLFDYFDVSLWAPSVFRAFDDGICMACSTLSRRLYRAIMPRSDTCWSDFAFHSHAECRRCTAFDSPAISRSGDIFHRSPDAFSSLGSLSAAALPDYWWWVGRIAPRDFTWYDMMRAPSRLLFITITFIRLSGILRDSISRSDRSICQHFAPFWRSARRPVAEYLSRYHSLLLSLRRQYRYFQGIVAGTTLWLRKDDIIDI